MRLIVERGCPRHIRSDNGSEFTACDVKSYLAMNGIEAMFIEPGSPWENGFVESFNSRFRDEFLSREVFKTYTEVRVLAEDWRKHYNTRRPHSSLGYRTPADYAAQYRASAFATLSPSPDIGVEKRLSVETKTLIRTGP